MQAPMAECPTHYRPSSLSWRLHPVLESLRVEPFSFAKALTRIQCHLQISPLYPTYPATSRCDQRLQPLPMRPMRPNTTITARGQLSNNPQLHLIRGLTTTRQLYFTVSLKAVPDSVYLVNNTFAPLALSSLKNVSGFTTTINHQPISQNWIAAAQRSGSDALDLDPADGAFISTCVSLVFIPSSPRLCQLTISPQA